MGEVKKVRLRFREEELVVALNDSATVRDFVSLLPLTLDFKDYKEAEKIAYPERKLSMEGAPAGSDPAPGDFTYYHPWGNFAIFYKDHGFAEGLVILGTIESGLEKLALVGEDFPIAIEPVAAGG